MLIGVFGAADKRLFALVVTEWMHIPRPSTPAIDSASLTQKGVVQRAQHIADRIGGLVCPSFLGGSASVRVMIPEVWEMNFYLWSVAQKASRAGTAGLPAADKDAMFFPVELGRCPGPGAAPRYTPLSHDSRSCCSRDRDI